MPGIYVRKASWLDWTQTRENSILTVPGSYWLCHKSNIYKFIFRYHRITRNVKQFSFSRELMKVVRRIIKNQPRQGQQFGTTHLLITYNHASWTRQDKMFAMVKFKERSVAAFSHAFVLTIKVCRPFEEGISDHQRTKYRMIASRIPCGVEQQQQQQQQQSNNIHLHENHQIIERKRGKDLLLLHSCSSNKDTSEKKAWRNDDTRAKILESKTKEESVKRIRNNENANKFSESSKDYRMKCKKEENENGGDVHNSLLSDSNSIIIEGGETDKAVDFIYLEKEGEEKERKNEVENFRVEKKTHVNIVERRRNEKKESIDRETSLMISSSSNDNIVDNTNIDSVNLPYQYLIEKEIENAKHEAPPPPSPPDPKNSLQEEAKTIKQLVSNQREQNWRKHKLTEEVNEDLKRKKCTVDNNVTTPHSSDITDLVMEGLMFTIRQGQDTVSVIEQKTKLEIDEVLENSEKIETQEGEKCLRNSSLLGLENLITMIDLPKQIENGQKCRNTIFQNSISIRNQSLINNHSVKYLSNGTQSKSSCNNSSLASTSFSNNNENLYVTNNCRYLTIVHDDDDDGQKFEENVNFVKYKSLNYKKEEEEKEEDEDIIPEVLQNNIFQSPPPIHSLKEEYEFKENFIENDKCLNDDDHHSSNKVTNTSNTNKSFELCRNNIRNKINAPTIISNQMISMEEIPLQLQKILRSNKLSTKLIPAINDNDDNDDKRNESTIKVSKEELPEIQSHREEEILFDVQSRSKSSNNNDRVNDDENERTTATASEIEIITGNSSSSTLEKKSEQVEEMLPNNIQDITKEFYQNLSYLRKKKHSYTSDKYVRSRRKSLNLSSNTNYNEMHVEMVKLFRDITGGAKVVVTRISTKKCS